MDGDFGFRGGLGGLLREGLRARGCGLGKTGGDGLLEAFGAQDRKERGWRGADRNGREGLDHGRNAGLCSFERRGGRVVGDDRRFDDGEVCGDGGRL